VDGGDPRTGNAKAEGDNAHGLAGGSTDPDHEPRQSPALDDALLAVDGHKAIFCAALPRVGATTEQSHLRFAQLLPNREAVEAALSCSGMACRDSFLTLAVLDTDCNAGAALVVAGDFGSGRQKEADSGAEDRWGWGSWGGWSWQPDMPSSGESSFTAAGEPISTVVVAMFRTGVLFLMRALGGAVHVGMQAAQWVVWHALSALFGVREDEWDDQGESPGGLGAVGVGALTLGVAISLMLCCCGCCCPCPWFVSMFRRTPVQSVTMHVGGDVYFVNGAAPPRGAKLVPPLPALQFHDRPKKALSWHGGTTRSEPVILGPGHDSSLSVEDAGVGPLRVRRLVHHGHFVCHSFVVVPPCSIAALARHIIILGIACHAHIMRIATKSFTNGRFRLRAGGRHLQRLSKSL
jgi:hypothetical protein